MDWTAFFRYSIKKASKIKKSKPTIPARIALRFVLYVVGRRDASGGRLTITPVTFLNSCFSKSISFLSFKAASLSI